MYNGGDVVQMPGPSQSVSSGANRRHQAYVKIIEQPASKALRFRYECEGRSAGSVPGASSTPENKTFPEIQVVGYRGRTVVVVSCVTKDSPYLVHPHNLVGKGCKKGVCTMEIPVDNMRVQFSNLGIQCVKKRDIESSLRQRKEICIDPFKKGYAHRNQPTSIDLNAVRLCFQVLLEGDIPGKYSQSLDPVVSDIIYDKKTLADLSIVKLSDCVSYVDGGRKDIILLCEKVSKENIEIRFFEEVNGQVVWQDNAEFKPQQVHKQHAIWFRTPQYRTLDVSEPVDVYIHLYRPSDRMTSEPLKFQFLPLDTVMPGEKMSNKRKRPNKPVSSEIFNHLNEQGINIQGMPLMDAIKTETRDTTSPYGGTSPYNIMYAGNSPNYAPSPNLSPAYNPHLDMATPSPDHYQYRLPSVSPSNYMAPDQSWNIPVPEDNAATTLLNMDTQQINSAELINTIRDMQREMPAGELPDFSALSLGDIIP